MINTCNLQSNIESKGRVSAKEIPDVRDGLTPTQRKVLAKVQNACKNGLHKCTATIITEFEGEHFMCDLLDHYAFGVSAKLYDTILNMVQEWKFPTLLQGNGNFGDMHSCYGNFAEPHYNEIKLSEFANTLFNITDQDLDENSSVFFACLPNVLISGTEGTMCNIPPHNLGEVIDAVIALIKNPDTSEDDLLSYIKGPDFIDSGTIINKSDLAQIYKTGVGNIHIRGKINVDYDEKGQPHIIISELPFTLISKFKCLDPHYNTREFMEVVLDDFPLWFDAVSIENHWNTNPVYIDITLKKTSKVKRAIDLLLLHSNVEGVYEYRALLLSDGKPKLMSLHDMLSQWLEFYKQKLAERNEEIPLPDNEICEKLLDIKTKFATPRKTEIIDI